MRRYAALEPLRLHTPGHKGALSDVDITELSDHSFPADGIAMAQKKAAASYGVKHAHYLCGGSSQGVKSALFFARKNAVIDINSHRAVYDGFEISGKKYIAAGKGPGIKPITVEQIESALTPDTGAVVITSPTYFGYTADVVAISELCRRKGLTFIIDGAHGAHFGFSKRLPAFAPYCDICNVSTHKTLSALTQTALLLDNLDEAQSERLDDVVDLMGTTSPSYLLYASIEYAVDKACGDEARYEALFDPIAQMKKSLPFLQNDDFTRPVLDARALGVDAYALNDALARRGVFSEVATYRHIVFIFTAENTPADVARLESALHSAITELK